MILILEKLRSFIDLSYALSILLNPFFSLNLWYYLKNWLFDLNDQSIISWSLFSKVNSLLKFSICSIILLLILVLYSTIIVSNSHRLVQRIFTHITELFFNVFDMQSSLFLVFLRQFTKLQNFEGVGEIFNCFQSEL